MTVCIAAGFMTLTIAEVTPDRGVGTFGMVTHLGDGRVYMGQLYSHLKGVGPFRSVLWVAAFLQAHQC